MKDRFVDTSGWAAIVNPRETFHALAKSIVGEIWDAGGLLLSTSYVLSEFTALMLRMKITKFRQIEFLTSLNADPSVEIVFIDEDLDRQAWKLWRERPDKEWSLVDCASFVVMHSRGIAESLTSDHHFEQAGFIRLLK